MSTPLAMAASLADRPGRVFLHSGRNDDGCGVWSFAASDPVRSISVRAGEITLFDRDRGIESRFVGDPLAVLEQLIAEHSAGWADDIIGPVPVAIGYLGYELGEIIVPMSRRRLAEPGTDAFDSVPDMWFGLYDAVWRHDGRTGLCDILGRDPAARRRLGSAMAAGSAATGSDMGAAPVLGPLGPIDSDGVYLRSLGRILDYIRAGDVYQVNLARPLVAPVVREGDALATYAALHAVSPAGFGAVLSIPDGRDPGLPGRRHVLSGSPERFLHRPPGSARLETRPIKGTRRRTGDAERDRSLATELADDDKERAEHLMIVDLERNDLGRVAQIGSVQVEQFGYIVELPTLYHMVSRVSCRLRPDVGLTEIVRATFPGGSITGAPKIRAMEIIAELEGFRRGPYTGAIGYIGLRQAMDFCVAIRTAVLSPANLVLCVGGGIVADSTAGREFQETEEKAAGWRAALAAAAPA
ncbi:MAG: anthranilate synthase component I family protein [Proteobacteria bacterium]|nr:anthranilate synthase component I family protein [Pseudomonadota bacterium]